MDCSHCVPAAGRMGFGQAAGSCVRGCRPSRIIPTSTRSPGNHPASRLWRASPEGPFGKDLEVFRGGDRGLSYAFNPRWGNQINLTSKDSNIEPTIGAAAVNSEQIVAVWEQSGSLRYDLWNGAWSPTTSELPDLPDTPVDGPVVLATGPQRWEVFV
jgi:hypothetical protein